MRNGQSEHALQRRSGVQGSEQYEEGQAREYEIGTGRPPVYMPVTPVRRSPSSAGLYDVVELILDRGLVIDAFVRVSLIGIELLTIDARVVIAGVDTYLRFAEAANRLDLRDTHARLAGEAGVKIAVNTDAHELRALQHMEMGVAQARRAWLTKEQVLNTRTWAQIAKLRK